MASSILNNGLLGMGGLGFGGNDMPTNSLLGNFYDPAEMRKYQLKQMLLGMGAGLVAEKGVGKGLALGLAAGDRAGTTYRDNAMAASALDMRKKEYDYQQQQRQEEAAARQAEEDAQSAAIAGLPPEMQSMAKAYPNAVIPSYVQQTYFPSQEEPKLYNMGGALVDASGRVVYKDPTAQGGVSADVEQRKNAALQMGLTPDDPAYKSFVLTGKMPREDQAPLTATDKKAILEADESVQANQQTIDLLTSVITKDQSGKTLNDRAGSGSTAGMQAWAARNDPTGFFNDATGEATTELQNIIMTQALGSLKSIFGGNPTEGERAILTDLQASVDKTPTEREPIITRAIAAANRRLAFNKQRADSLRGQTYYKPGGASSSGPSVDDLVKQYAP